MTNGSKERETPGGVSGEESDPSNGPTLDAKAGKTPGGVSGEGSDPSNGPILDAKAGKTPGGVSGEESDPSNGPILDAQVVDSSQPKKKSGHNAAFLWTGLGLAVLSGIAYYVAWPPRPPSDAAPPPLMAETSSHSSGANAASEPAKTSQEKIPKGAGNVLGDLKAEKARSSSQLSLLLERVKRLEQALGQVKKMIGATTLPAEAAKAKESLKRLNERLASLQKQDGKLLSRVNRLEKTGGVVAKAGGAGKEAKRLSASVAKMEQRLASLENTGVRGSGLTAGGRKMVLAIGQLREALGGASPFAKELAGLKSAAVKEPDIIKAIAVLEPFSGKGIPTLASLRQRFDDMAGKVFTSSVALKGDRWFERTVNKLTLLVALRRTADDKASDAADAVVARVEANLAAGNLKQSVAALERLSEEPAAVAAPWLADARARLKAERVKASLHVFAVSLLGSRPE